MNAIPFRLSADARKAVRTAITKHPKWTETRKQLGLSIETMTSEALVTTAALLEIDISQFTSGAAASQEQKDMSFHKPRPHDRATVDALMARFIALPADMIATNDALFCNDVYSTITKKQDGAATDSQFHSIRRIVERYEGKDGARAEATTEKATEQQDRATLEAAEKAAAARRERSEHAAAETRGLVAAPAADTNAAGAQLAALITQLAGQSVNAEQVARIVDERIATALENSAGPTLRLEIKDASGTIRAAEGHCHPKFATLARAASARMANGYAPNIWLAGPAGSGKTHAGHQLAKALGVAFHLNGALSMPHELLGFIDAGGTYHRTPFRDAYERGGVYMFDEVDGSDNAALLALNAALANGRATFPDAAIERHPDCVIVASANTWGLGATAEYVGRAKIDAAFLSRFPVRIAWDYDEALEIAISGDAKFAARVIAARAKARAAGLKVLIDPRASQAGAALIAAGMSADDAAACTYLANLSADQRRMIEA
jgi:hypothetical protein